jgi:hypothetical protein
MAIHAHIRREISSTLNSTRKQQGGVDKHRASFPSRPGALLQNDREPILCREPATAYTQTARELRPAKAGRAKGVSLSVGRTHQSRDLVRQMGRDAASVIRFVHSPSDNVVLHQSRSVASDAFESES